MLAFKVEIYGKLIQVAGVADWSILALHITASRGEVDASESTARQESTRYLGGFRCPMSPISVNISGGRNAN